MALGITSLDALDRMVDEYFAFDEFVVDVETKGEQRGNPYRNDVFWISLAGPGRCDVIPCGHPLGERVYYEDDDELHRVNKASGHYQERRINELTGKMKWFNIPDQFTEAPKQLWISDVVEALRPLFFSKRRIVGHNVKFDVRSLAKYFGCVPPGPYGDTVVAAKLVNENQGAYRLRDCIKREFKFQYEKIGKLGPEKFPYSEARLYSYLDSKYTWLLWQKLKRRMDKTGIRHVFDMEMDLLPALIDMEDTGIPIDEEVLTALGREFRMEAAQHKVAIDQAAGFEINLDANAQLADLVYDTLGHPCKIFTATGQRSTAASTLEAFSKDPVIQHIQEHAKLNKLQSTFIEGIERTVFDGRVHPTFNQVGAVSGRISCNDPNVQQIPSRTERGRRIREVFVASPGNKLIIADLSQIELRVLAHFTQDPVLLKAYRNNDDLHGLLAARVFGPDYTPIQRSLAKNGNFSVLFGAYASTLVRKYGFPDEETAQQVLDGFYETYKKVQPWKNKTVKEAYERRPAHVTTILGRKRRLPGLHDSERQIRSGAQRQAVSVTISGSAADLFKLIMIQCHDRLLERGLGHILMTVHDEVVVEVPEADAEEGLAVVKETMENVVNPFTQEPMLTVPIVADGKIADRWSEK